jgi:hypothetical protein
MATADELRKLAAWYRDRAERAGTRPGNCGVSGDGENRQDPG